MCTYSSADGKWTTTDVISRLVGGLTALCLAAAPIGAKAQVGNDLCPNAERICLPGGSTTVNGTNASAFYPPDGTINPACTVNMGNNSDVWYYYTASGPGTLGVNMCSPGQGIYGVLSLHDSCPSVGQVQYACAFDGCGPGNIEPSVSKSVVSGETVYIRVASFGNTPQGSFILSVSGPACPANDDCSNATPLSPGTYSGAGFSTYGATPDASIAGCGGTSGSTRDVWYRYTASAAGNLGINTCGTAFDTVITVHTGCPATPGNQVACNNNCGGSPCGGNASCVSLAVTSGSTYWIRVADASPLTSGSFTLTLGFSTNDACAGAADICPSPTTGSITVTGNNSTANTDGAVTTLCASSTSKDVWYRYTPAATGYMTASTCGSSAVNTVLSLHYATCPATASNQLTCLNDAATCGDDATISADVVGGITYLIRVASFGNTAGGNFTLTVTGPPCGPPGPPPNDECADAEVICPTSFGALYVVGDNSLATASAGASSSCASVGRDVWYRCVPSSSGTLSIQTCSYTTVDTVLSIHTGSPGTAANQIAGACNDNACGSQSSLLNVPVTAATNYWVRVGSKVTAAGGPFILYVQGPDCQQTPANDLCQDAIVLTGAGGTAPTVSTALATNDGTASCGASSASPDVWYVYTPPYCSQLWLNTCSASYNTILSVYQGSCPASAAAEVACNNNCADALFGSCSGTNKSCLRVPVRGGVPYLIRVSGVNGATGSFPLIWTLVTMNAPANVQANPPSVCPGDSTTLSASLDALALPGDVIDWYTGGCGNTLIGTGTSIVVSPTAPSAYYYARVRNPLTGCTSSSCSSVLVSVAPLPPTPNPPTASPATIIAGQPSTLTVTGLAGAFATIDWYTGSCGGTFIGTDASITVSPTTTTPYYARQRYTSTGCTSLACSDVTVTVAALVDIVAANPPTDNPYLAGIQPFRDVLDTGTTAALTAGIGGAGSAAQGGVQYAQISVTFTGTPSPAPTPANISVSCTGGAPLYACPTVTGVSGSGSTYTISLSGVIPPLQCSTLTFAGTVPGAKLQYQSQPGNLTMDAAANPQDLLGLIQALNNGSANLPANLARYNLNRSTGATPVDSQDLLRLVQLLNGTNTTQPFNGVSVAQCP